MILSAAIFFSSLLASAALTKVARGYALQKHIVDHPSDRGLHDITVPRGGGVAILAAVTICLIALLIAGLLDRRIGIAWVVCGLGFGSLGWVDDHIELSALIRLSIQIALATIFCVFIFQDPIKDPTWWMDELHVFGFLTGTLAITWIVNLYNFMDGADGLAATEGLVVAGAGAVIIGTVGAIESSMPALAVAGGAAGFLFWNWQPARIFMGDVGSYFLGFQFSALILYEALYGSGPWVWLILLAPFVSDASLTLLWRISSGHRWWEAHRSHLYQLLILRGRTHAEAALCLGSVTLLILAPVAWMSAVFPTVAPLLTLTIYVLTAIIWAAIRSATNSPR